MKKQITQVIADEPFMLKIMMFVGGFALRSAFFVPVVSLGCWIVLGNRIPLHQSASVGLAIAAIYSAFDFLIGWLNQISPDTIG
ncbi:MAG: hypothetical protein ACK5PB_22570 [Pirellula sp.]